MRQGAALLVAASVLWAGNVGAEMRTLVFNGEGNRLNVYDVTDPKGPWPKRTLIASDGDAPGTARGEDINAQICFFEREGKVFFVAGEDSNQSAVDPQGWGVFQLTGRSFATLDWEQRAKLVPTYQQSGSNAENYGCGFLSDRRLVLSDVGDQQPGTPGNGQLHVWFPRRKGLYASAPPAAPRPSGDPDWIGSSPSEGYCKVDVSIPTAGGIFVDAADRVYVASNRPQENSSGLPISPDLATWLSGIYRYSNLPKSIADCAPDPNGVFHATIGDCATCVRKELVIPANPVTVTPSAVTGSAHGTLYVSSVLNGTIAEYTEDGLFLQLLLGPGLPLGNVVLPAPLPTLHFPTPFGIATAPDGSGVYYADIGLLAGARGLAGPGDHTGTVGKVPLLGGVLPLPHVTIDRGLAFPDGIAAVSIDLALTKSGPSPSGTQAPTLSDGAN